eukprot:6196967-Pleurochrysis_carterae.AAC.1
MNKPTGIARRRASICPPTPWGLEPTVCAGGVRRRERTASHGCGRSKMAASTDASSMPEAKEEHDVHAVWSIRMRAKAWERFSCTGSRCMGELKSPSTKVGDVKKAQREHAVLTFVLEAIRADVCVPAEQIDEGSDE